MKDIKHIAVFDFDGTLIYTAEPLEGKKLWLQATGTVWPHRGWWGRKESLDTEIFYPAKNEWVSKKYEEAKADPDTTVILMTGRLVQLEAEVRKVLEFHGFEFDRVYCNTGGDTFTFKMRRFDSLLREFPHADLTMYDDRTEHVLEFQKWARNTKRDINIIHIK